MVDKKLTGYDLSRAWFNYLWDHPGEISSNDTALFFWLVEIWNRLGHPSQLQITAKECKDGMSAKSYNTYKKSLDFLIKMGFLKMIKQSTNQYQCNVVALSNFDTSHNKALGIAFNKARAKAHETFIKPITINQEPLTSNSKQPSPVFENKYPKNEKWVVYIESPKLTKVNDMEFFMVENFSITWEQVQMKHGVKFAGLFADFLDRTIEKSYKDNADLQGHLVNSLIHYSTKSNGKQAGSNTKYNPNGVITNTDTSEYGSGR